MVKKNCLSNKKSKPVGGIRHWLKPSNSQKSDKNHQNSTKQEGNRVSLILQDTEA